jgi:hypothetical protein
MTVKGKPQLPKTIHRLMARLLQLHLETDPVRIGRRFGVSAGYVRQMWRETQVDEMPTLAEAIEALRPRQAGDKSSVTVELVEMHRLDCGVPIHADPG